MFANLLNNTRLRTLNWCLRMADNLLQQLPDLEDIPPSDLKTTGLETASRLNLRLTAAADLDRDHTTGLLNRQALVRKLHKIMTAPGYCGVGVIYISLGGYQEAIDRLGEAAGRTLIREVSLRLSELAANVFRNDGGSGEFIILIPCGKREAGWELCHQIHVALGMQFWLEDQTPVQFMPNTGYSWTDAQIEELVGLEHHSGTSEPHMLPVDIAMCGARAAKRMPIPRFGGMVSASWRDLEEEQRIRTAVRYMVANQDVQVWYQPIVSLTNGGIYGFECFLRPEGADIRAGEYEALHHRLASSNAINELWPILLDQVLQQLVLWRRMPQHPGLRCTINVSPSQLEDSEVVGLVARCLRHHKLPGDALVIEVTEHTPFLVEEMARRNASDLRKLGVGIFLDDFGSGYSNLDRLSLLQDVLTGVKLDKLLVDVFESRPDIGREWIRKTAELARSTGLEVVAEGIEKTNPFVLAELGCTLGQGHSFGEPRTVTGANLYLVPEKVGC